MDAEAEAEEELETEAEEKLEAEAEEIETEAEEDSGDEALASKATGTGEDAENEDDDEDGGHKKKKKKHKDKKKKKKRRDRGGDDRAPAAKSFVDEEVDVDSDVEVSADESDEGEDDGFVVDGDDGMGVKRSAKKRRRDIEYNEEVDEDDLALIKENTGVSMARNIDDEDVEDSAQPHRKRLKRGGASFLDDEDEEIRAREREEEENKRERTDNFFVDDEENADLEEDNFLDTRDDGYLEDNTALQQIRSIFRYDIGADQLASIMRDEHVLVGREEAEEEEQGPIDDEEAMQLLRKKVEPTIAEKKFLTDMDEKVRRTDLPERLQARVSLRHPHVMTEQSIEEEAKWIYDNVFQRAHKPESVKATISSVLKFIRMEHLEIPFIAKYRKGYFQRQADSSNDLSVQDLYAIDEWDEKWDQLSFRRFELLKVLSNARGHVQVV